MTLTPRMVASARNSLSSATLPELSRLRLRPSGRDGLTPSPDDVRRATVGVVGVWGDFGVIGEIGMAGVSKVCKFGAKSTIA